MALTLHSLPRTPSEPITEILHGVAVTDPYRWLEEQNSSRTRRWLEEQTAYTRTYVDALPGRNRLRKRVEELLAVESISDPWKIGNRYFYLKRSPHQEQPVIMMREGDFGGEVILVDPADRRKEGLTAVSIVNISRDGSFLAYGIRHGGEDLQSIEFFDVNRKQVLPDQLPLGFGPALVFSPNKRGFYYSHEISNSARAHYRAVYWHEFGTTRNGDVEVFVAGEDPHLHLSVFGSSDGQFLWYLVTYLGDPITFDLHVQDVFSGNSTRQILKCAKSISAPVCVHDKLFVVTDWKSPNRRIVAIDPSRPEGDRWISIVPESPLRLKDFAVVGDSICVGYVETVASKIEVFDLSGQHKNTVPCPMQGTAHLLRRPVESDTLFYNFSSFHQPWTIFSYHPLTGQQREWAKRPAKFDPVSIKVERVFYKSKDGTNVSMTLAAKKPKLLTAPLPVFLSAYGGFGISSTPQFNVYSNLLIESGFLLATPNLRGGGEFGGEWHLAGKRRNRQNAFDDFIAAAEWLINQGYAIPEKIAIAGGSNGGLLVGVALTQRPDLFRAAVCLGPLMDMVRYHLFDLASTWLDEYGISEVADDFHYILAYSPYQGVKEGLPYPAVLFVSGDADTRCNPMHARKMTARLQAATSSGRPILLDYKPTWGHVPVQPLTQRIDALSDRLAFICHELGVSI